MQMAPVVNMFVPQQQTMKAEKKEYNMKGRCESCFGTRKLVLDTDIAEYHTGSCCCCCPSTAKIAAPYGKLDKLRMKTMWECCCLPIFPNTTASLCVGYRNGIPDFNVCMWIYTEKSDNNTFENAYADLQARVKATPTGTTCGTNGNNQKEVEPIKIGGGGQCFGKNDITVTGNSLELEREICCCIPPWYRKDKSKESFMFDSLDSVTISNEHLVCALGCCGTCCADVDIPGALSMSKCGSDYCMGRSQATKFYEAVKTRLGEIPPAGQTPKNERVGLDCCGCNNYVNFEPSVIEYEKADCCNCGFTKSAMSYTTIQSVEKHSSCCNHIVVIKTDSQLREKPLQPYWVSTCSGGAAQKVYDQLKERITPPPPQQEMVGKLAGAPQQIMQMAQNVACVANQGMVAGIQQVMQPQQPVVFYAPTSGAQPQ